MSTIDIQKLGQSSIGCGSIGTVYPYNDETDGSNYVVKYIWVRNERELIKCESEQKFSSSINHPNILTIADSLKIDDSREGWMIYQKMDRMQQDMSTFINTCSQADTFLPKREILKSLYYLIDAVDYLASHGIVNRSIKPSNIFLDRDGNIKLSDFSLSRVIKEEDQLGIIYYKIDTRYYASPEMMTPNIVVLGKEFFKVDVWGLGILIIELCLLKTKLLTSEGHQRLHDDKILKEALLKIGQRYGQDLADLLKGFVDIEPKNRKWIKEIKDEFEKRYPDDAKAFMAERGKESVFSKSQNFLENDETKEKEINYSQEIPKPIKGINSLDLEDISKKWKNFRFEKAEDPNMFRASGNKLSEVQSMLVDLSKEKESKDIYELAISLAGLGSIQGSELIKIATALIEHYSNVKYLNISFEGTETLGQAVIDFLSLVCQNMKQLNNLRTIFKGCKDATEDFQRSVQNLISEVPEYEFVTNDVIFENSGPL